MIDIIQRSDYAAVVLVVRCNSCGTVADRSPANRASSIARLVHAGNSLVRAALVALERLLVGRPGELPDASEIVSAIALLSDVEVIEVRARREQGLDYIDEGKTEQIRARDLDVLVCLNPLNPRGGILTTARYGVWTCQHGDTSRDFSGRPGYLEVMKSRPTTSVAARMLSETEHCGNVIYQSLSQTNQLSLADNTSNIQWKSLHFIPRKLRELYQEGEEIFLARVKEANTHPQFHSRAVHGVPTNAELGILLYKKLIERIKRRWEETFYFTQWILLYDIRDGLSTNFGRFGKIVPPKDRFWADPFVLARDDKYYIFIEELLFSDNKGHISLIVMNKDGTYGAPVRILEGPHHFSYPFVFEFEDNLYMIPECYETGTVSLYKCTNFPHEWSFEKILMDRVGGIDATQVHWQGKWWMFTSGVETAGASYSDELFLYYSDSPCSDSWVPHPRNPIVSDVRSARPAGRLFVRDGHLYRPSQNSSRHYGYGFNICEITKLTETDFEERIVSKVEPNWDRNIVSTHTINYESGLTIIDGQLRRRRWPPEAH